MTYTLTFTDKSTEFKVLRYLTRQSGIKVETDNSCGYEHKPNAKTIASLKNIENGTNLTHFKNTKDLFDFLKK